MLDGLRKLGEAARDRSAAKRVAVTGSVGKTSTKDLIAAITDAALVKAFTGTDVPAPSVDEQLQLLHDEVMPAFR